MTANNLIDYKHLNIHSLSLFHISLFETSHKESQSFFLTNNWSGKYCLIVRKDIELWLLFAKLQILTLWFSNSIQDHTNYIKLFLSIWYIWYQYDSIKRIFLALLLAETCLLGTQYMWSKIESNRNIAQIWCKGMIVYGYISSGQWVIRCLQ